MKATMKFISDLGNFICWVFIPNFELEDFEDSEE